MPKTVYFLIAISFALGAPLARAQRFMGGAPMARAPMFRSPMVRAPMARTPSMRGWTPQRNFMPQRPGPTGGNWPTRMSPPRFGTPHVWRRVGPPAQRSMPAPRFGSSSVRDGWGNRGGSNFSWHRFERPAPRGGIEARPRGARPQRAPDAFPARAAQGPASGWHKFERPATGSRSFSSISQSPRLALNGRIVGGADAARFTPGAGLIPRRANGFGSGFLFGTFPSPFFGNPFFFPTFSAFIGFNSFFVSPFFFSPPFFSPFFINPFFSPFFVNPFFTPSFVFFNPFFFSAVFQSSPIFFEPLFFNPFLPHPQRVAFSSSRAPQAMSESRRLNFRGEHER